MILTYRILTAILYPLFVLLIFLRKFLGKEDPQRFVEKIFPSKFNVIKNKGLKLLWFHAASIGEMKSILPIIKEINQNDTKYEFLITTVTLSSANLARIELKKFDNVKHRFFPIDIEFLMRAFLNSWKPNAIFLVDSEIWPNLILNAKKNKIPLALLNARITKKSFKKWSLFSETAKKIFNKIDVCLASSLETKNLLLKLNARNVIYTGNIKFLNNISFNENSDINEKILSSKTFWFAASTHDKEDKFCLETHLKLREKFKNFTTVIAPRHINRSKQIKKLSDQFGFKTQILNKNELIKDEKEIIIINSFGYLNNFYKISKSVFIGKSLLKKFEAEGGQNPIDAAMQGCKVYHGPYVYNFKEIYEMLNFNKISEEVASSDELAKKLLIDLRGPIKDPLKFTPIMNNLKQKTLDKTMSHLKNFIFDEINKT